MPDEAMDAITTAIKAYRPRGLGTVEDGEARLAFVVATVAAVSWKTPKHARTAMTHAWAYTGWLAANGRALEQSVFTVAHIDEYLKARAFAKQGTRDAVRSYLVRLAPAAPATVSTPGAASVPAVAPTVLPTVQRLSAELEAALGEYAPAGSRLSDGGREFVRDVARRVEVSNLGALRTVVRNVTPLVAMVEAQHRPLRIDVVFATTTIEQYLTGAGGSLKSQASYASILYALQEQLLAKTARGNGTRRARSHNKLGRALDDDTTARLVRWARTRRRRDARRASLALIAVVLGTGCDGAEAGRIEHRRDVVIHDDTTVDVTLRTSDNKQRVVRANAKWAPLLVACVRDAPDDEPWLIGGGPTGRNNRASRIADDAKRDGVDFDLHAMRDTWLADACVASGLPQILTAAGLSWPGALDRIWPAVLERAARR